LVLVTGASGVGKSSVGGELRRRGYVVYDVDADGLARWVENASGLEVVTPTERDDAWFAKHTYRLPGATVRGIAEAVGDGMAFVCGTVGNEGEIWELFSRVISLSVDAKTLRRRLAGRTDGFGSTGDELERVLAWHARVDADNARYGAVLVDARDSVEVVADRVLTAAGQEPTGEIVYPSPIRDGKYADPDGVRWQIRGGVRWNRLERLMKDPAVRLLHVYLRDIVEVPADERAALMERIRPYLKGKAEADDYTGFRAAEFKNESRRSLLVVEETC